MLCAHLTRGAPHWNVGYHDSRDVSAYSILTDVVPGLTYQDGSPVRPGWINSDKTIKSDKLRVVTFDKVGAYNITFGAATWDGVVWYAAGLMTEAKRYARTELDPITRLGNLGREPSTLWIPGKAKGSRKM